MSKESFIVWIFFVTILAIGIVIGNVPKSDGCTWGYTMVSGKCVKGYSP